MADDLYDATVFSLAEMPRHLRNAAAMSPSVVITVPPHDALVLARVIERDQEQPAMMVVDRTPPFAALAAFSFALMLSAQVCAMLTPAAIWLARVLAGWIHG